MTASAPTTYTARAPEDILAVIPVVLGFVPSESVVMLTFGATSPFHARVDLPPARAPLHDVDEVVGCLLEPALRHGVRAVVFVLYAEAPLPAERARRRLVRAFAAAGVEVVDVMRADGRRWFPLLHGRRRYAAGVPYDVGAHPFAAQAVLDGLVTHCSRADLAATLTPEPDRVAAVSAVPATVADPPDWVRSTARRVAASGSPPSVEVAARLLRSVSALVPARDAAWFEMPRSESRAHVALWTDLLRRAPDDLAASAAAVLAVHAWRAGQGALAWCAVDRAQALAPGHSLAALVADLLGAAVPPDAGTGVSTAG